MPHLVLLRHGESQWNLDNRFTGWTDVDLSDHGVKEAHHAGKLLAGANLAFDAAFTSVLKRAIRTLWIALDEMDLMWLPYTCSWRLNERHYGALQGLDKAETAKKYGEMQVRIWRRSYDTSPPPLADQDQRHPRNDPRYADVPADKLPASESLKDTLERLMPYWREAIQPALTTSRGVLVCAHGNSLRAIVKHLLKVPDQEIPGLEIPTGNPLVLELDGRQKVVKRQYLDEERAMPLPKG
jgi:2,3-bisphosphoglycerate-dependent phosphoglycerate mutase